MITCRGWLEMCGVAAPTYRPTNYMTQRLLKLDWHGKPSLRGEAFSQLSIINEQMETETLMFLATAQEDRVVISKWSVPDLGYGHEVDFRTEASLIFEGFRPLQETLHLPFVLAVHEMMSCPWDILRLIVYGEGAEAGFTFSNLSGTNRPAIIGRNHAYLTDCDVSGGVNYKHNIARPRSCIPILSAPAIPVLSKSAARLLGLYKNAIEKRGLSGVPNGMLGLSATDKQAAAAFTAPDSAVRAPIPNGAAFLQNDDGLTKLKTLLGTLTPEQRTQLSSEFGQPASDVPVFQQGDVVI